MKINIDLLDLFENEDEGSFRPEIKDIIIEGIINKIYSLVNKETQSHIRDKIQAAIEEKVKAALDSLIDGLMDYEFTETSSYGENRGTTTVRQRIFRDIERNMVWRDGSYDSDRSPYTKAVKKAVEDKLSLFATEYHKEIDARFVSECLGYAQKNLQERLGIKPR